MLKNIGKTDRVIRVLIVLVVLGLYLTGQVTGRAAVILGIISLILLFTSITGFCGLYQVFGLKTCCRNKSGQTKTPPADQTKE